ncbi:MAG TPA: superoxide dismutase [Alphaproteobacteria bacterium]|jgi:Fe-Mn family superoxide dismutase
MPFKLPPLPYAENALEPHMSERTLQFHHGKHHKAYVETLNKLVDGTKYADMTLEGIIQATAGAKSGDDKKIFNNAAQVWNHTFFWHCLSPHGGGAPDGDLLARIEKDFGDLDGFRKAFKEAAVAQFGSGWAWLVEEKGKLAIVTTSDAMTPIAQGQKPLLACDVWEHAYYLDYQNERPKFVETFLRQLAHWHFAAHALHGDEFISHALMEGNMASKIAGSRNEGEGSYIATRAYNKGVAKSVAAGKGSAQAKAAEKALDGAEGADLKRAEEAGKRHSHGEDPAFRKIGKAS